MLKIVTAILYAIVTLALIGITIVTASSGDSLDFGSAIAFVLYLYFGAIAYCVQMLVAIVGLIISAISKYKGRATLGTVVYFIVFSLLPIVSMVIYLAVAPLVI